MTIQNLASTPEPVIKPATESASPLALSQEETLAYLELTPRQTFGLAYALIGHCRRFGAPRTALQHEMAGLRDFLLDLLDEHQVETLLQSL